METLDKKYAKELEEIKASIQGSELLSTYLDTEEDEDFKALLDAYEPAIAEVYKRVANLNPLQLESFEIELLAPEFEGMFLPKILGYSVLRGEIEETYKYRKPQDHFKRILLSICESANFEMLRKRIGQTVQLGFALSSDIWITNLINQIENKKVKAYLLSLKNDKYRDVSKRKELYDAYSHQLATVNFQSTSFPTTPIELDAAYHSLKTFLIYRSHEGVDNTSLMGYIGEFIKNEKLLDSKKYLEILTLIGILFPLDKTQSADFQASIKKIEKASSDFDSAFFTVYSKLHDIEGFKIDPKQELLLSGLMKSVSSKEVQDFFKVTDEIHTKGFVHVDAIEAVRKFYEQHLGVSLQNDCLRMSVIHYIHKFLSNLEPEFYPDYFEMNKIFTAYIGIFGNEKFNQDIKESSMKFITKCLAAFTDKRGKDYQDIKKFVTSTFRDLGFMSDKELVELFKTKRKKTA